MNTRTREALMARNGGKLTEREKETLHYIGKGFRNKEISKFMKVSVHTVADHTKAIYAKLDVTNRTEAAMVAASMNRKEVEPGHEPVEPPRAKPVIREQKEKVAAILPPRVIQCLEFASRGYTSESMAQAIELTKGSVENNLMLARKKLDAATTTEACCIAIRKGLIA